MEQELKEPEIKPNKLAFQLAVVFSVYTLILVYVFKFMGIDSVGENMPVLSRVTSLLLSYVPYAVVIVYAQRKFRADLGGQITFGQAFSAGFRVSSAAGMFIGLLMILYYKVLDPGALDHLIDITVASLGKDERAIRLLRVNKGYVPIRTAFGAAISYTVLGIAISIAGAITIRKEKPLDFNQ